MPVEVEDVVEVRLVSEHTGQLLKRGRAENVEADAVAVRAEQFEQRTGNGLERHVPFGSPWAADDHEDVEGLRIGRCGLWLENQVGLAADKGVGEVGEVAKRAQCRVAHQLPRQRNAFGTAGVDDN